MKQLKAEWIPYLKAYRMYEPQNPKNTVAYENDLDIAEQHALAMGYDEVIECDADTMHVECW